MKLKLVAPDIYLSMFVWLKILFCKVFSCFYNSMASLTEGGFLLSLFAGTAHWYAVL